MVSPQSIFLWCLVYILRSSREISASNDALPGFLLTGPKRALSGTDEKFCLHLQGIHGASNASLELFCDDCWLSPTFSSVHKKIKRCNGSCILLNLPIPPGDDTGLYKLRLKVYREDDQGTEKPQVLINSVKEIMIIGEEPPYQLIQTDKPSYKPGEKLRFRTVTLDRLLQPISSITLKRVWISDPFLKVITEWTNVTAEMGFVEREFRLPGSEEPGTWAIVVDNGLKKVSQNFDVVERVIDLRAIVTAPQQILRRSGSFNFTICANQKGFAECYAEIEVYNHRFSSGTHTKLDGRIDAKTGCTEMTFDFSSWLPDLDESDKDFDFNVTGVVLRPAMHRNEPTHMDFHSVLVRVITNENKQKSQFHLKLETPPTFKLSLPYFGKVVLREEVDGKFIADKEVRICFKEGFTNPNVSSLEWILYPNEKKCQKLVTDERGEAQFSVVPNDSTAVILNLEVNGYDDNGNSTEVIRASAKPLYSPSSTFAVIEPVSNQPLTCNNALQVKIYLTNVMESQLLRLNYIVTGRGDILAHGTAEDHVQVADLNLPGVLDETNLPSNASVFEFELHVAPAFYPKAMLTVFFPREGELVTAQTELRIAPCFPNPATFQWDNTTASRGTKTGLTVGATPGSLCGVSVVHESVTLLRPEFQLTEENVLGQLNRFAIDSRAKPRQKTPDYLHCISKTVEEIGTHDIEGLLADRSFYEDVIQTFEAAGLLVMSNWTVESRPCHRAFVTWEDLHAEGEEEPEEPIPVEEDVSVANGKSKEKVAYVPEVSLWAMQPIESTGFAHLETRLPKKGGPWVGRVLCVSNTTGLGMSSEAKLVLESRSRS